MPATVSKTKPSARKVSRKPKQERQRSAQAVVKRARPNANTPGERHQNEGHGRRLTAAFEALEAFPALAESRDRLVAVPSKNHVATADIVTAVESDVALTI